MLATDQRLLYTRAEAAKLLGLSIRTLDNFVAQGFLKPTRAGRLVRFTPSELERFAIEGSSVPQ